MTRRWTTATFLRRTSFLCLIGSALLLLAACGGGSSATPTAPSPPPAPPPQPPPTPVTTVIAEGGGSLAARTLGPLPFITTATGTIGVTVDWTFSTNDVNIFLVRGTEPCTIEQFNNNQCPFLAFSASTSAKPERLSVPNLAAGPYTLYIGNFGSTQESVSFQITLTSVPSAAGSSTPTASFGGIKGTLNGIIKAD